MICMRVDAASGHPAVTVSRAVFGADAGDEGTAEARTGGRLAVVDAMGDRAMTHADLAAAVGSLASGLAREGVGPGTVVALHLPDSPEFVVALHAVTAAGATPMPVRPTLPAAELAALLTEADARVVITWPVLLDIAQTALREMERTALRGMEQSALRDLVTPLPNTPPPPDPSDNAPGDTGRSASSDSRRSGSSEMPWSGFGGGRRGVVRTRAVRRLFCFGDEPDVESVASLHTAAPAPDVPVDPARDAALIACTRGEGVPARAVRLTHAEVVAGLTRVADAGLVGPSDIALSALPLADPIALNGLLNPGLRLGATVVTLAGAGRHELLRAIQDHRVTVLLAPPRLVEVLAYDRSVPRYDLRSLRAVVSAGGPLSAEAARACANRLGCPVRQAYGTAEAAGITHLNPRGVEEGTLDSVGRGLLGVAWRVLDPATGTDQPAYQPGELCLRLPMTSAAAVPVRWLTTGDQAFADEHGRVYILGRLGAGRPDPPAEPDAVLAAHPAVADAVIVPVPDLEVGLAPHAFVVATRPVAREELLTYVNGHVPSYRKVVAVHVVDMIPRSPGGRVRRRALLQRAGLS
ncbi:AMP-binding protein [Actinomadura rupiterrae]|uniref:AMP-binding protein n=1 Tax=Actinomadura rupiterrae TaxID=559627 RepID=UPI0020A35F7D|nr:AMP-binding protein [Actinomadura rupiterrae]MCP2336290.1 acyl-coenzyme A synthetase/AMP-(fatty) acid ligase [Actinomadura rupiterrae]